MAVTAIHSDRNQTTREELANSISHGAGLVAAVAGTPFLILRALTHDDAAFVVGASVFAATMIVLYLTSTVYHATPRGRTKRCFRVIEHSAIFLLIAGTYTPFTLGLLRGVLGWTLFGIVWALAAAGVGLKASAKTAYPVLSSTPYLLMGWLIIIAADPLLTRMPTAGLLLLVGGGVAYTLGMGFYATDARLPYGHFVWHLFVIAGTTCHYFAVLGYAM